MDNVIGDRLHEAKRQIVLGQYEAARRTLKPIRKHPKAREWLEKLDRKSPPKKRLRTALVILVVLALVAAAVIVTWSSGVMADQRAFVCTQIGGCS